MLGPFTQLGLVSALITGFVLLMYGTITLPPIRSVVGSNEDMNSAYQKNQSDQIHSTAFVYIMIGLSMILCSICICGVLYYLYFRNQDTRRVVPRALAPTVEGQPTVQEQSQARVQEQSQPTVQERPTPFASRPLSQRDESKPKAEAKEYTRFELRPPTAMHVYRPKTIVEII